MDSGAIYQSSSDSLDSVDGVNSAYSDSNLKSDRALDCPAQSPLQEAAGPMLGNVLLPHLRRSPRTGGLNLWRYGNHKYLAAEWQSNYTRAYPQIVLDMAGGARLESCNPCVRSGDVHANALPGYTQQFQIYTQIVCSLNPTDTTKSTEMSKYCTDNSNK